MDIRIPKGVRELAPEISYKYLRVIERIRDTFESYGYLYFVTPTYEYSDLFILRSGEEIRERMFVFRSKSGKREYALRPEITAQIARSVALGRINYPRPFRLYYIANVFRYEEPQRGRYREFRQAGVELIGSNKMLADAETIVLLEDCVEAVNVNDYIVGINDVSLVKDFLARYVPKEAITHVLTAIDRVRSLMRRGHKTTVSEELEKRGISIDAGPIEEFLNVKDPAELTSLKLDPSRLLELFEILEDMGARKYEFAPTIVRGLEYYTSIVYEMDVPSLGGASQVAGGGRYDELIREFGGPNEPAVGFAIGIDRIVEASGLDAEMPRPDIYVIPMSTKGLNHVLRLRSKYRIVLDVSGRKLKKALSRAAESGAKIVIILGKREVLEGKVTVKNLSTREQVTVKLEELEEIIDNFLR